MKDEFIKLKLFGIYLTVSKVILFSWFTLVLIGVIGVLLVMFINVTGICLYIFLIEMPIVTIIKFIISVEQIDIMNTELIIREYENI